MIYEKWKLTVLSERVSGYVFHNQSQRYSKLVYIIMVFNYEKEKQNVFERGQQREKAKGVFNIFGQGKYDSVKSRSVSSTQRVNEINT